MDHAFAITLRAARAQRLVVSTSDVALLLALLVAFGAPPAASAPLESVDPATAVRQPQTGGQQVVLAQDDGLMLVGKPSALGGRAAPQLDDIDETMGRG